MKRLIPHPVLSLSLVLMWLLLTQFSLGHLVLGSAIALVAGRQFHALEPESVPMRRPWVLVKLFFVVGADIFRSNIAVATLILTDGRHGQRVSDFVEIPLSLRSRPALGLLAMIVTATPGTAWIAYDSEKGVLTLHVFDLVETDDWAKLITTRYEAMLKEVFE